MLIRRCPQAIAAVFLTSLVTGCPVLQQANPSKAQESNADTPATAPEAEPPATSPSKAKNQPYGPVPIELPLLNKPKLPGPPPTPAEIPPYSVINEQNLSLIHI